MVWVIPNEIPDGTWGAGGRVNTLADIVGYVTGDSKRAREHAARRLSARRAVSAS